MSDQARQARVEAGVKAREAEGLQQYVDEARQEIGKLKEERAQLLSHVGQLEKQVCYAHYTCRAAPQHAT